MPGTRTFIVTLALFALLGSATAAQAASTVRFGIQDDAWLAAGPGPDTLSARIAVLKKLGVRVVRYNLRWDQIAALRPTDPRDPADPAYDWSYADPVVNALHAAGIPVLLTIYGSPRWANGDRAPAYAPTSPSSIAAFATAAARRFPWVRSWAIWNEPNEIRWLRPVSPVVYTRQILNPAYAALQEQIFGVQVAGGVTAPRGNAGGMSPLDWIKGLYAAHAHLDAYAHNPYPASPFETPFSGGARYGSTVTMATMPRLISTLDHYFGRKPIWITEYAYQTSPPDRVAGVSYAKQALYTGEAALRAWELPQVSMVIHFLYRDEPSLSGWQSGLQTVSGKLKPAFDAFRLPLAQVSRTGTQTVLWGQVRPRSGRQPFRLQQLRGSTWVTIGGVRWTSSGGVFRATVRAGKGALLRIWSPRDGASSPALPIV
jgi:hypothetical protein